MRRNQVISKRKLISNIVGWPDYYISLREIGYIDTTLKEKYGCY